MKKLTKKEKLIREYRKLTDKAVSLWKAPLPLDMALLRSEPMYRALRKAGRIEKQLEDEYNVYMLFEEILPDGRKQARTAKGDVLK